MQASKKIVETDDIFSHVHLANRVADEFDGVLRLSIDTKANVNVGPFSRRGYSRQEVLACDHDFKPDTVLKPFGIYLPAVGEIYFYFSNSHVTADFMADALEDLWPVIKAKFNPHTIAINADNDSKYNPIERVWGVLENHWKGQLLDTVEKTLGLARTMTYKGKNPVVKLVNQTYETGIKLTQKAMQKIENMIERLPGIEKWAVEIPYF